MSSGQGCVRRVRRTCAVQQLCNSKAVQKGPLGGIAEYVNSSSSMWSDWKENRHARPPTGQPLPTCSDLMPSSCSAAASLRARASRPRLRAARSSASATASSLAGSDVEQWVDSGSAQCGHVSTECRGLVVGTTASSRLDTCRGLACSGVSAAGAMS